MPKHFILVIRINICHMTLVWEKTLTNDQDNVRSPI